MRTKRRRRERARRRRRGHALGKVLTLTLTALAIVAYIYFGFINNGPGDSISHPQRAVSAVARTDNSTGWEHLDNPQVPQATRPADSPKEIVMISEPVGDAIPRIEVQKEADLAGGMDDFAALQQGMKDLDTAMHNWYAEVTVQQEARRKLVAAINRWLDHRGSPCAGTGELWVQAQERTGVSAALMIGIFDKESTSGTNGALSRNNYNGWGQMGPKYINWYGPYKIPSQGGYCCWPSWEASIPGAFDFVRQEWGSAQVATDCYTYCGGDKATWFREVEYVRCQVLGWAE